MCDTLLGVKRSWRGHFRARLKIRIAVQKLVIGPVLARPGAPPRARSMKPNANAAKGKRQPSLKVLGFA